MSTTPPIPRTADRIAKVVAEDFRRAEEPVNSKEVYDVLWRVPPGKVSLILA